MFKTIVFLSVLFTSVFGEENSSFPFHVSVENGGKHICSGAIIRPAVVLTTASCLQDVNASQIRVRAGAGQLHFGGTLKNAKQLIRHKRYLSKRKDYDIALINLVNDLKYSDVIQPIDLSAERDAPSEGSALLIGHGLDEAELSENLDSDEVKISVPIHCKNAYAPLFIYITDRIFCAELKHKHVCTGDPGSLIVSDSVLIGISAWEEKCGSPKFPGIYTNIGYFKRWIESQTNSL